MNLKELLEKRKTLKEAIAAIAKKATDENRALNDAENKDLEARKAELVKIEGDIEKALDEQEKADAEKRKAEQDAAEKRRQERIAEAERALQTEQRRTVPSAQPGREAAEINVLDGYRMSGTRKSFRSDEEAYKAGMWILGNMFGNEDCRRWSNDNGVRALNGVSNTAGAILVPDTLQQSILWYVEERGTFARYAQNVPMSTPVLTVPKSTGEVTVYAVSENQTSEVTESEPTFGGVEIVARTWAGLTRVSRNVAADAVINLAEHISQKFGYAHADKQDQCGWNGTGTSTYHGIHGIAVKILTASHTASVSTAASGNVDFGTLDLADFETVVGKLPQWAESGDPAWYISKAGKANSMDRLMYAAGGNTSGNLASGAEPTFLGYPVRIVQVLPSALTGTTGTLACLFGSLRYASAFGQMKSFEIQTLTEKYATYNQIGFLGFGRWGINNHELGDTTNAGAMIALKFA